MGKVIRVDLTESRVTVESLDMIATRSPLTGIWLDASSAGDWAVFFKRTGTMESSSKVRLPNP